MYSEHRLRSWQHLIRQLGLNTETVTLGSNIATITQVCLMCQIIIVSNSL